MCALCGVLGAGNHWTDMAGRAEFSFRGNAVTRGNERARRAALIRPMVSYLGLDLNDWGGSSWLIEDGAGRSEEAWQLTGIWSAVERLAGRSCDPLDPDLLARLAEVNR